MIQITIQNKYRRLLGQAPMIVAVVQCFWCASVEQFCPRFGSLDPTPRLRSFRFPISNLTKNIFASLKAGRKLAHSKTRHFGLSSRS